MVIKLILLGVLPALASGCQERPASSDRESTSSQAATRKEERTPMTRNLKATYGAG